jgi:hypothetical protein
MSDMTIELFLWLFLCAAILLMVMETVDFRRWRWSIADMLKLTFLAAVMAFISRRLM